MARAVENDNRFAAFDPQHVQRMVRLASFEPEGVTRAAFGRQIKTVHCLHCRRRREESHSFASQVETRFHVSYRIYRNRFLAFSKRPWSVGLASSPLNAANSRNFAFCSAFRCVGTST